VAEGSVHVGAEFGAMVGVKVGAMAGVEMGAMVSVEPPAGTKRLEMVLNSDGELSVTRLKVFWMTLCEAEATEGPGIPWH
jgi:hypothetical protein